MNKKGKIYYSLGLGEPHFGTPKNIIRYSFKAMKDGKTKYSNPAGILKLRKEVSKKLLKKIKYYLNLMRLLSHLDLKWH